MGAACGCTSKKVSRNSSVITNKKGIQVGGAENTNEMVNTFNIYYGAIG